MGDEKTLNWELFPQQLKEWAKRPDLLWYDGDLDLLNTPMVSVVGSRNVSPEGLARTRKLTRLLVSKEVCVVSGLAEGVDASAHTTALDAGGKTIAVMGTPIGECYPLSNKELKTQIRQKGLVLSQFAPKTKTQRSNFPRRNELMSALSFITIVVEAKIDSGTRHQVKSAIKLGRKIGFLSSLVEHHFPWVDEAINSGFGFSIDSTEDLLLQIEAVFSIKKSAPLPGAIHAIESPQASSQEPTNIDIILPIASDEVPNSEALIQASLIDENQFTIEKNSDAPIHKSNAPIHKSNVNDTYIPQKRWRFFSYIMPPLKWAFNLLRFW